MKKMISLFLAVLMLAGMGATAFAADSGSQEFHDERQAQFTASGSYAVQEAPETVYVEISWSGMDFTYYAASKGEWKPDSMTYSEGKDAYWKASDGKDYGTITITNRSAPTETALYVEVSFAVGTEINEKIGRNPVMRYSTNNTSLNRTFGSSPVQVDLEASDVEAPTEAKIYVLPGFLNTEPTDFGTGVNVGTFTITLIKGSGIIHEPPGPIEPPGIDSVSPAPEAGEMAANG